MCVRVGVCERHRYCYLPYLTPILVPTPISKSQMYSTEAALKSRIRTLEQMVSVCSARHLTDVLSNLLGMHTHTYNIILYKFVFRLKALHQMGFNLIHKRCALNLYYRTDCVSVQMCTGAVILCVENGLAIACTFSTAVREASFVLFHWL